MTRLTLFKKMRGGVAEIATLEEVLDFKADIEDLLRTLLREHAYFETV